MTRKFNELKMEALEFLKEGRGKTSKDLARHLEVSLTLASDVLGRLFRFKTKGEGTGDLADRRERHVEGFRRPAYVYAINPRGLERLERYLYVAGKRETSS